MDVMKNVTFCVFIGHERQKLFWGIIYFIRRVLPSNFVVVTFLLSSLRKGHFLRRRLKRYRPLMEKIAVLMVFDIRLHASSRISMRNRHVYDGWVYVKQYYADVLLFRNVTVESVSTSPKAYVGDNGSTLCTVVISTSICFKAFQYIRICQRNTDFYPKHLLCRRFNELFQCKERMDISHTIVYSFYGEKKC